MMLTEQAGDDGASRHGNQSRCAHNDGRCERIERREIKEGLKGMKKGSGWIQSNWRKSTEVDEFTSSRGGLEI